MAKWPYIEARATSALEPNEGIAWANVIWKVLKLEVMMSCRARLKTPDGFIRYGYVRSTATNKDKITLLHWHTGRYFSVSRSRSYSGWGVSFGYAILIYHWTGCWCIKTGRYAYRLQNHPCLLSKYKSDVSDDSTCYWYSESEASTYILDDSRGFVAHKFRSMEIDKIDRPTRNDRGSVAENSKPQ